MPSLRIWLQSTALLTVIAGYAVLLAVHSAFATAQRNNNHQDLAASIARLLSLHSTAIAPPSNTQLHVELQPAGPALAPQLQEFTGNQQWLVSRRRLPEPIDGLDWLELRQNVTRSLQQERLSQFLLIAAAGVSILLTSLLLRPVLYRGLVIPLDALVAQLQALEANTLGQDLVNAELQPQELRPIVFAFNQLQQRLAAAWQREKEFVDGAAHELRTPITVISGHAQRLNRDLLPAATQRSAAVMASEAERMASILDALRDLSRLDSGRLPLQIETLDAEEQLLMAYERCFAAAADRLRLPPPRSEPVLLFRADSQRLQQCLKALISNAMLYSPGLVQLQAEWRIDQVVLHVLDHGPGIPEAEREQVFRRFARGAMAGPTRGVGLGLALVDQLLQAMGGALSIRDAPGGGADVQLQFRVVSHPPAP